MRSCALGNGCRGWHQSCRDNATGQRIAFLQLAHVNIKAFFLGNVCRSTKKLYSWAAIAFISGQNNMNKGIKENEMIRYWVNLTRGSSA